MGNLVNYLYLIIFLKYAMIYLGRFYNYKEPNSQQPTYHVPVQYDKRSDCLQYCNSPQSSICWTQVDPEWMQQEGNVLYLQPHQRGHKCHLQYLMPHKCGDWWGLFAKLQYEVSVPHYTTTPTSPQPTCDTPVTLPPTSKSNYKMIWVRT